MNKKQLQELKDYLINDDDFYQAYEKALQDNIDKSLSIMNDIIWRYQQNNWEDGKRYFNHYVNSISSFIDGLEDEWIDEDHNLLNYYLMKESNQGVAWLKLDDKLYINLDDLFIDWKNHSNG